MAHDDDSQERLNEQNEAHIKLLIRLESEYNRYGGGLKKVINDSITAMKKENLTSLERAKLQNKMVHDLHTEMSSLTKGIKEGKKTQQDLWDATKELSAAMEVVTDETERSTLASVRRDAAFQASSMAFNENLTRLSESIARTTVSTSARFVTQMQTGMSAATAGADMMTGVIDIMGAGAGAAGRATTAFGGAIALANPVVGGFVAGLGTAITFLAETGTALAKFGVQIAKVEVEKTVTSFNTMSSSGAMFADGMTGMRAAAGAAKLTLEQFTAIVKSSSSQLADSGMSVGAASEFTGRVLAKGGDSMKKSLAKLGYSFEEQGELVAQVMKDMRGSSVGPLKASDAEVAEQTQKYAENLRIIADITGEDAKGKMEEARNMANQLAFQQKMTNMTPVQRANVTDGAMANMNKQEKMDFMDIVNFGAVINKQGALMAAMLPEYSSKLNDSVASFRAGTLDDTKQREINAKHQEGINKQVMGNTGVGTSGATHQGGVIEALSQAMMDEFNFNKKYTKEAVETATKDTKGQKDTKDDLTKNLVGAEVSLQNFQRAMEKDLTPVIAQFGKFTGKMLGGLEDKLADLGLMSTEQLASHKKKKSDQDAMLNAKEGHTIGFGLVANLVESMGWYKERADDRARMESDQASAVTPHAAGTLGVDKSLFKSVPGGEVIRAFEDGPEAVITKDQFDSVVRQVQALTKSSMGAKSTISMDNSKFNATTGVPQTATGAEHVTIKQALKALVDFGKLMKTNVTPALTDFGIQLNDVLSNMSKKVDGIGLSTDDADGVEDTNVSGVNLGALELDLNKKEKRLRELQAKTGDGLVTNELRQAKLEAELAKSRIRNAQEMTDMFNSGLQDAIDDAKEKMAKNLGVDASSINLSPTELANIKSGYTEKFSKDHAKELSEARGATRAAEKPSIALSAGKSFDDQAPAVMKNLMADFDLSKEQASGIVGNLGHESAGLKAGIQEGGVTQGRGGLGWAQWTGPRRKAFEAYLAETGQPATDPSANYGFLKRELTTTHAGALDAVKHQSTSAGSMMAFEQKYEAAGVKNYGSRQQYANRAMGDYDTSLQNGGVQLAQGQVKQPTAPPQSMVMQLAQGQVKQPTAPPQSMVMQPAGDTLAGMANATPGQVKQPTAPPTATQLAELDAKKSALKQSMFGKDGKMSNDDKLIKDVTAQIEELDTQKDAIRRGISRQSDYYKPSQVADATVMDTQKSDAMAQEKAFRKKQNGTATVAPPQSMVMKPAEDTLAGMANATPAQPAVGGNSSDRVTAAQRVVDITDKQPDINKKQQDLVAKHSTAIQASSMVMKPAEDTLAGMANATPAQGQVKQPAASGIATPSIPATTQTAADYGDSVPATQAHRDAEATAAAGKPTDITAKSPATSPDKHREMMVEALRLLGDIKTAMISGNKINQKTATNTA